MLKASVMDFLRKDARLKEWKATRRVGEQNDGDSGHSSRQRAQHVDA